MMRFFVPVSNETIAQALAEVAIKAAMGLDEAALIIREGSSSLDPALLALPNSVPSDGIISTTCTLNGAGYFDSGVRVIQSGIFWDVSLTHDAWPDGWAEDYLLARWILAGAVRSQEMAAWTELLDPRAQPRPSLKFRPIQDNPYGLPVFLLT